MEEEKYMYSQEEEISKVIQRFERMKRNNENYFFDVIEFETIIDYYLEKDNQAKALEAASIANRQHPNSVPILIRNAKLLLERGRTAEALQILKKLENIEPGNHEIFVAEGTAFGMIGDINNAIRCFDEALTKDSDDIENILFSITSSLQNLNYYEQLIPYLKRFAELEPFYAEHLYDLAYASEKINDYENSLKYYLKYLDEEPFSDNAWHNLGMVYCKLEKFDEAIEAYEYALAINPQNNYALFNKGVVLSGMERYQEAVPIYLEYLKSTPESFEAMTYLAECYTKTGNISLAKKYFYEAVELSPEFSDAWIGLGVIELNAGNYDKSLNYLRKAVEYDPDNPEIWYMTGKVFCQKNNKKHAIKCFRESLRLDPFLNQAWYEIGKIIIEEQLVSKTLPFFEKAYKIIGDFPGINYLISALYLRSGDKKAALFHLKTALELDKEIFEQFAEFFPKFLINSNIKKLLRNNNLT
ncbi:MAG: tetratricopeptide repeat protein [Bacteroidales bacterium]|nr:tetratricopeptide repeat protein [Bacteroidales bacterium]